MSEPIDRASVYRGAFSAVLLQWSMRLVGLFSVVIVARLLSPADFGLVGLAAAALALVELLGAVGLRQALLRLPEPEPSHLDTAWTIQLILFSAMALGAVAMAPLVGGFYGEPALTWIVAALGLRYLLLGLVNIGIVDFDRKLQFGRDLRLRLAARLPALVVTVVAALLIGNYWALVLGLICQTAFFAAGSWIAHPYRPRLSLARRSELLGVSLWMFAASVASTVQQQMERLVLGRFGTAHLVGLYSASKDLSEIFTQEIAIALNRVTFVTVAQTGRPLRDDPWRIPQLLGAYAMIAAPMGFGLAATAEDSVRALLGSQWVAAAPYLQVVAVASALYAVYKAISSALQASGFARGVAFISGGGALLLTAAVVAAAVATSDAMAIAWAALGANLALLLVGTVVIGRVSRAGMAPLFSSILRPFAAAGLMLAVVRFAAPDTGMVVLDLVAAVALGAAVYGIGLLLLWLAWGRPVGAEAEAVRLGVQLSNALRARLAPGERPRRA